MDDMDDMDDMDLDNLDLPWPTIKEKSSENSIPDLTLKNHMSFGPIKPTPTSAGKLNSG